MLRYDDVCIKNFIPEQPRLQCGVRTRKGFDKTVFACHIIYNLVMARTDGPSYWHLLRHS